MAMIDNQIKAMSATQRDMLEKQLKLQGKTLNDIKEEAVKNGFYNPFWNKLEKEGIGSLAYKGQWNLFDQIIISGNLVRDVREAEHIESPNLVYTRCEVWNRDFLKGHEGSRVGYPLRTFSGGVFLNGYSDHFPTQIFLVKKVRPRDKQAPAAVPAN